MSNESEQSTNRKPTADPAEDNAYFPSPYSLGQYTAPKTDFDGLVTDKKYEGNRWRILVIATDERYMLMQNGTFFSTGNHPVETLLPLHHMMAAGYPVDIATVSGNPGKFEWWAYPKKDPVIAKVWEDLEEGFKHPKKLADVLAKGLRDYAAVFIPGGHGAMNAIPESTDVRDVLSDFFANDRLIISLCHGPAAFLSLGNGHSENPLAGRKLVAFPDSLDKGTNVDIGYLPGQMPWALGQALTDAGLIVTNDDITGATLKDGNLITGDSPLAANQLGKDAVEALLKGFAV